MGRTLETADLETSPKADGRPPFDNGPVPGLIQEPITPAGVHCDAVSSILHLGALLKDPQVRRLWLLWHAMQRTQLENAIKIAQEGEHFIVSGVSTSSQSNPPVAPTNCADGSGSRLEDRSTGPSTVPDLASGPVGGAPQLMTVIRKSELHARLASGSSNAELASEFGLTLRQVQGFRMQVARQARRAIRQIPTDIQPAVAALNHDILPPLVDEVVCYLRQQDDVVVRCADRSFIVNNRFRLDFQKLLTRANRMRLRQGKPEFVAATSGPVQARPDLDAFLPASMQNSSSVGKQATPV